MYLNKSSINNNILKCSQCHQTFDEYCKPKFLCFKTICTTCELTILKQSVNKEFKCGALTKYHSIPDDGFCS